MKEDRLQLAIAAFEDSKSTKTFAERISELRQALIWEGFDSIKLLVKGPCEEKPEDEEKRKKYESIMDYFKDMEKLYASDVRINKLIGKNTSDLDKSFMEKVLAEKNNSMPDIVRSLK